MKNLKVMFTAVAVVAVLGGSLAFKSAKFSSFYIYQATPDGLCPVKPGLFNPNSSGTTFTNITTSTTSTLQLLATDCTATTKANIE